MDELTALFHLFDDMKVCVTAFHKEGCKYTYLWKKRCHGHYPNPWKYPREVLNTPSWACGVFACKACAKGIQAQARGSE